VTDKKEPANPGLEQLKATQAAIRDEKLRVFREQQAMAIDMQRALDKDREQRKVAEEAKNLGRMSDAELAEWRRKHCGF